MRPGPQIMIEEEANRLAESAARIFFARARDSVLTKGVFSVALSGGNTPRGMHRLLAKEPLRSAIPWAKIHLFWVDERCVPRDHPASNYGAAKKDFIEQVPLPRENIHPMPLREQPAAGATIYEALLREFFRQNPGDPAFPAFDLIYLGLGKDGHTASLFPGTGSLVEAKSWVIAVKGGEPNVDRLTMTLPVLNQGREVVFLVAGKEKAMILQDIVLKRRAGLPAREVQPVSGKLTWLIDREASRLLPGRDL
jgi:6-phosphogluconolactonase